jgi:hypothetical protein
VVEAPCCIACTTEILGVGSGVKELDASEIESQKACFAVFAPHTPGFHDVVQCEDFIEIQATVPIVGVVPHRLWNGLVVSL